uniref:AAA+ ATPase domain-containing protein n=1 Tax=Oryza glumipatula TaxID=40148 RepID=A0A0E0BSK2_9ORYZ
MAGFGLLWSRLPERVHNETRNIITSWSPMLAAYLNPYEQITISQYTDDEQFRRNELFDLATAYLNSTCMKAGHKLKAEIGSNGQDQDQDNTLTLFHLAENQEVVDSFQGARMWWNLSFDEHREHKLVLVFHKRHRELVQSSYLRHIIQQERELRRLHRQSHIPWNHPATFDTLAMDPAMKDEIKDDLTLFQEGKEYHSKVGKAWKRGYLLYGPSGTGKSSMISAMSELLRFDVYDLDLTTVRSNDDLRKLFLETTEQSIIVIEDIHTIEDDLITLCKDKKATNGGELPFEFENEKGKVTLSGLLNFVDGLWSPFGGERIFVLTTNHVDKLDPALIRQGRMDMHIEMSYCRFEAFKMLANNYLGVTEHPLFAEIQQLLETTNTTPAEVAHNLMPLRKWLII